MTIGKILTTHIERKMIRILFASTILLLVCSGIAWPQGDEAPDLNTILMQSAFRVHGPKKDSADQISFGTGFLMGKPTADKTKLYYVLITAAHVLEEISGEEAVLTLRERHTDGTFTLKPWNIRLRDKDKNLYVKHATADVVALYVDMPDDLNVPILPVSLLADDAALKKFEIHPGDELLCLGFPLFVSSDSGFPILRSGKIASYPIVPTKVNRAILFDFSVFDGNSGGPVYFVDHGRTYGGTTHLGESEQFVVGLVTSQVISKPYNNRPIELASIVPSAFIIETIDLLPAMSPYK
jgi:hypothetical protein